MVITVGIDEVGRGCWAGPVVAGAVVLPNSFTVSDDWRLTDSKRMTVAQRNLTNTRLQAVVASFGIGWVQCQEVDAIGLTAAVALAMRRALNHIVMPYDEIIIDGSYNFLPEELLARTLVKADYSVPAVSAASVMAKVARDQWMSDVAARQYPLYGFEKHVGYGTALHKAMLLKYGVTPLHRQSYKPIQAIISKNIA